MLTPRGEPFEVVKKDLCVLDDEDMLENTKPNLISLSTSSSNHTNVSATTNSFRCDIDAPCVRRIGTSDIPHGVENTKHTDLNHLTDMPIPAGTSSITSTKDSVETNTYSEVRKDNSRNERSETVSMLKSFDVGGVDTVHPKNYIRRNNISSESIVHTKNVLKRNHSVSMHNLYDVSDSPTNVLTRVNSQPQLLGHVDVKNPSLTRSLSFVTMKGNNRNYTHVESKVKHYIQQLKRERATEVPVELVNQVKKDITVPQMEQECIVHELQKEIQRLQTYLEERDSLLQEVQANHHSLLLEYGEAKNRLDHLRLAAVKPKQDKKYVQTESNLKADKNISVSLLAADNNLGLKEVVSKASQVSNQGDMICDVKPKDKQESKNAEEMFWSTNFSDVEDVNASLNEKNVDNLISRRNSLHSPDMALLKVSSWFTSLPRQPLPVPSCYGSLPSSGCSCDQQDKNTLDVEEKSCWNLYPTNSVEINRLPAVGCQPQHLLENQDKGRKGLEERILLDPNKSYFLPVDKCECWNTHNLPEYVTLEGELSKNSVQSNLEHDVPHVFSVPPLNLACSKDSTSIQPSHDGDIPDKSVLGKVPSHIHHSDSLFKSISSSFQKCSRKQRSHFEDKHRFYLDTPTSYKSILINCETDVKTISNESNGHYPVSVPCDMQRSRNGHHTSNKNVQTNACERNQLQHSRSLRKTVTSDRHWLDHSCKCCECIKDQNQPVSRYVISMATCLYFSFGAIRLMAYQYYILRLSWAIMSDDEG